MSGSSDWPKAFAHALFVQGSPKSGRSWFKFDEVVGTPEVLLPSFTASGELSNDDGAAWDRVHARMQEHQFILGPPGTAKADLIRSMMPRSTRVRIWLRAQKPYVLLDEHGAFGCKIAVEYPQFVTNLLLRRRRRRSPH